MLQNYFDQEIREGIAKVASVADKLPGVVILHDIRDWCLVWMSNMGLQQLGIEAEEIRGLALDEYMGRFFNAEDAKEYAPKIFGLLERNNDEETVTYFQQVRFKGDADWHWHMSSTKIFMRNPDGLPILTITMSFPVDPKHHLTTKAGRLLEENSFIRENLKLYKKLSQRECEVLRLLALGKSASETAIELFISLNTVETHRKNIKQKLNTNSYYDLSQFARAFDLI